MAIANKYKAFMIMTDSSCETIFKEQVDKDFLTSPLKHEETAKLLKERLEEKLGSSYRKERGSSFLIHILRFFYYESCCGAPLPKEIYKTFAFEHYMLRTNKWDDRAIEDGSAYISALDLEAQKYVREIISNEETWSL